jgi:hypothetical protein
MKKTKYILYLEPSKTSYLFTKLSAFFKASRDIFGPNEAHQYHPHCSMTGFFDVNTSDKQTVEADMVQCLDSLINLKFLDSPKLSVGIDAINTVITSKPLFVKDSLVMQSFPALKIVVRADFCDSLSSAFGKFLSAQHNLTVRPKRVNHISLAYNHHYTVPINHVWKQGPVAQIEMLRRCNSFTSRDVDVERHCLVIPAPISNGQSRKRFSLPDPFVSEPLTFQYHPTKPKFASVCYKSSSNLLEEDHHQDERLPVPIDIPGQTKLARKLLDFNEKLSNSTWDVAIYELEEESFSLDLPHKFRLVHRWNDLFYSCNVL